MKLLFDVTAAEFQIIRDVLATHLGDDCQVWVFGSRAKNTARFNSDLDLAIECTHPLSKKDLIALNEAFDEAKLAFSVDVVDLKTVEPYFKEIIDSHKVVFPLSQNEPQLRFPEFSGEWGAKRLEELAIKIGDGLHGTPIYSEDSDIYFINGNNLVNGVIHISENTKKVAHDVFDKNDKKLTVNSILVSINGTIGSVSKFNNEKIMLGKSVAYFNFKDGVDFYYHALNTMTIQSFWISELTGSTIKNLSLKTLRDTVLFLPSLPEQTKIATFLSAVDTKIDQLTQKKALLETYKKGAMQKIFSQQIRFKADDGGEYPVWEEKKLGEVAECLDNFRKPLNDEERQQMQGKYPYWGANNIMDYVDQYIFDETIVLLAEDGGNFDEYATRKIANLSHGKCWVNNHTHVLRGINLAMINEFLYYSLVHKNITGFVSGGTRAKLTKGEMLKIPLITPSYEEQTKIANFLSAIERKIYLVSQQLEQAKAFKKGLLQQMFV